MLRCVACDGCGVLISTLSDVGLRGAVGSAGAGNVWAEGETLNCFV